MENILDRAHIDEGESSAFALDGGGSRGNGPAPLRNPWNRPAIIGRAADAHQRKRAGDVVTYVINRNVNFTNVCVKHCGFAPSAVLIAANRGALPKDKSFAGSKKRGFGATGLRTGRLPPDMDGASTSISTHPMRCSSRYTSRVLA
jgi:hypothetical protein